MKKFLLKGIAAVALMGCFVGCSKDVDLGGEYNSAEFNIMKNYEDAFITRFGQPAETQDWGFGRQASATTRALTRSQSSPSCPDITQPYTEAWVTEYLTTASEPTASNITNNDANASVGITKAVVMPSVNIGNYANWAQYNRNLLSDKDIDFYDNTFSGLWSDYQAAPQEYSTYNNEENYVRVNNAKIDKFMAVYDAVVAYAGANGVSNWLNISQMPEKGIYGAGDFVTNFKITGTYNGPISVAGSEGITDNGTLSHSERTIVVTGTWNINEDQRIGSLGKIIIANGGTVNVSSGKTLNMVNQARLVVLPGGQLTGAGSVEVNNGNAEGEENYNGGTIDVATFNNNFGKFYNYNKFLVTEYQGGAQESNFYNHALVNIHHFAGTGSTANARIFNACQFYVQTNARIRNYEGIGGSALIVGGQLMFSSSEDGTSTPTYVGLADGALVKCNTLYNNGTSWTGPTSGYAALEIDSQIDFLNWEQDHPENGGYFENNIYVKNGTWNNVPDGNGYHQTDASDAENYSLSIADYKFWKTVANCRGNGGVKKVEDGNNELLPASEDFVLGSAGCTPGFKGNVIEEQEQEEEQQEEEQQEEGDKPTPTTFVCRVIAEDLTVNENTDFDFNDVVFDVYINDDGKTSTIRLQAAGGTLPLYIGAIDDEHEVHKLFKVGTGDMVNTNMGPSKNPVDFIFDSYLDTGEKVRDNLHVWVMKGGTPMELFAPVNGVPSKIAVGEDYPWCDEREDIDKKWTMKDSSKNFSRWVRGDINVIGDSWYQMVIEEAAKYQNKKKNP